MSALIPPAATGSWGKTWVAGAAITLLAGLVPMIVTQVFFTPPPWGGRGIAGVWDAVSGGLFFMAAFVVLPSSAIFMGLAVVAETRGAEPLWLWLILGVIAVLPVMGLAYLLFPMGRCIPACAAPTSAGPVPALLLAGFGVVGATVGWHVRRGRRWR